MMEDGTVIKLALMGAIVVTFVITVGRSCYLADVQQEQTMMEACLKAGHTPTECAQSVRVARKGTL